MKIKNKESLKKEIETLGLSDISKISSINYLARTNVGIDGLVKLDAKIKELECGVWSLLPLGMGDNKEMFENQLEHVTSLFNSIIDAAKLMEKLK